MNQFHPKQEQLFNKLEESDALAHAFLFTGPEGLGKLDFARNKAFHLQGADAGISHPDIIETPVPLPIKEAKDLKKRLSTAPYSGRYKIVIIDQAESMHIDAANSLLKMIEEPRGSTIFFLISSYPEILLNTIYSRCYEVRFSMVPLDLMHKNIDTKKIDNLEMHWKGRPRFANNLLNDDDYYRKIQDYKKDCNSFIDGSLKERFDITEKYAKINKGSYQPLEMLRIWMEHVDASSTINKEELIRHLLKIYKNISTTNANFYYLMNNFAVNTRKK